MRKASLSHIVTVIAALIVGTTNALAAVQDTSTDSLVGQWSGTDQGSGTGSFELLLRKDGDKLGGKVSVTTDGGNEVARDNGHPPIG